MVGVIMAYKLAVMEILRNLCISICCVRAIPTYRVYRLCKILKIPIRFQISAFLQGIWLCQVCIFKGWP